MMPSHLGKYEIIEVLGTGAMGVVYKGFDPGIRRTVAIKTIRRELIAGDRPGLLSRIARVLTAYDVNLHTARISTLGSRAEDTFLVTGAALNDPKTVVRFESDLVEQLRT